MAQYIKNSTPHVVTFAFGGLNGGVGGGDTLNPLQFPLCTVIVMFLTCLE